MSEVRGSLSSARKRQSHQWREIYGFSIQIGRITVEIRAVPKSWRRRWHAKWLR